MKKTELISMLGSLVFITFTTIAIILYPNYDLEKQFLSELGTRGVSALFFNSGAIITGVTLVIFGIKLNKYLNHVIELLAEISIVSGGVGLIGVGLFPMRFEFEHNISAFSVFFFTGIALLFLSKTMFRRNFISGVLTLLIGLISLGYLIMHGNPILQKISVVLLLLWYFCATRLLKM